MSKNETKKISQVIADYLKVLKIDRKVQETGLVRNWETVMGKTIARETDKIYIKNGTLYVHLKSAVLRNELFMMKSKVIALLNEGYAEPLVKDVIFR
jgi:predicted nucleic acid-binding Zn ribbon protein